MQTMSAWNFIYDSHLKHFIYHSSFKFFNAVKLEVQYNHKPVQFLHAYISNTVLCIWLELENL